MQSLLIPFFLVANISVNDDAAARRNGILSRWKVETELMGETDGERFTSINNLVYVACIAKNSTDLLCKASDMNLYYEITKQAKRELYKHVSFGIKFNKHGVQEITAPKNVIPTKISFLKKFAEMLNIGTDMKAIKDGFPVVQTVSQGLFGKCDTTYTFLYTDTAASTGSVRYLKNYDVFAIPFAEESIGTIAVIDKESDTMQCDKSDLYFDAYFKNSRANVDYKSRKTRYRLGDNGYFQIWSRIEEHFSSDDRDGNPVQFRMIETLRAKLENVEEATEQLPEVIDPETFTLSLTDAGKKE